MKHVMTITQLQNIHSKIPHLLQIQKTFFSNKKSYYHYQRKYRNRLYRIHRIARKGDRKL